MITYYGKNKNLESNAVKAVVNKVLTELKRNSGEYKDMPGFNVLHGHLSGKDSSITIDAAFMTELDKIHTGIEFLEEENGKKELDKRRDVAVLAVPVANLQQLQAQRVKELAFKLDSWNRVCSLIKNEEALNHVREMKIQNQEHLMKTKNDALKNDVEYAPELPGNACSVIIGLHRLLAAVHYCLAENIDISKYKLTPENVNDDYFTAITELEKTIESKVSTIPDQEKALQNAVATNSAIDLSVYSVSKPLLLFRGQYFELCDYLPETVPMQVEKIKYTTSVLYRVMLPLTSYEDLPQIIYYKGEVNYTEAEQKIIDEYAATSPGSWYYMSKTNKKRKIDDVNPPESK